MSAVLSSNRVKRATAALRNAQFLAFGAALVQLVLFLPGPVIAEYKLFFLVSLFSGVLGIMAFRITHREVGETISALRGLDALGMSGRHARGQVELSLSLLIYIAMFVPVFNLLFIAWTWIKAFSGVRQITAAVQQKQEQEQRALRMRSG